MKLHDPEQDWQGWQYDESGSIARQWTPAYRLPLDEGQARYYQVALRALAGFANGGSFPGGYTRSTLKKLAATRIPAYDAGVDLTAYFELEAEHAAIEGQIRLTDRLIDQIVYRLYGLTEGGTSLPLSLCTSVVGLTGRS